MNPTCSGSLDPDAPQNDVQPDGSADSGVRG
jgi:hypothetical protein